MPHRIARRLFLLLFVVLFLSGCSTSGVAPVENYSSASKSERLKRYHIVQKGETLYSIAWRAKLDYHKLAAWNRIDGPEYRILPGQHLRLKPPKKRPKVTKKPRKSRTPVKAKPRTESVVKRQNKPAATVRPARLKLRWGWPTIGSVVRKFSKADHRRQGIRIAGQKGQRITAAESGKVVYSGTGLIGYGNLIIIKHNKTYLSAYAHNRRILVKEGMKVVKGAVIAEMGAAPDSKKPALHFEIRKNGQPVNPLAFLPKRR